MVEAQSLVISKYNPRPTVSIGFKLHESIITSNDNISLYDNSGTTPNLTSPGADRYKITMTLIDETNVVSGETFYPVYTINQGNVISLQSKDNVLNELGKIISSRTDNISGDFIEKNNANGRFSFEVAADSDNDYLQYKIGGGTAFVKGNKIEKTNTTVLRVAKARSLIDDLTTINSEFVVARYGNYFLTEPNETFGIITGIATLATVNLYSAINRGGSIIGTARIRNIDEYDNSFRIHAFDVNFTSNYGLANVRSIGTDAANYANILPVNNRYDLYDRIENSLLFPLPKDRVQEVTNVSYAARQIYTSTTDGSGIATFSTGSSNVFVDYENWIVSANDDGELFSPPTVSGTPTTSATITGLPINQAVTMLGYETIAAVRKTKTLTAVTENLSLSGRTFYLGKSDVYKFISVVDDTTGENITYKFTFDNGQRDNYYSVGRGTLKTGISAPIGNITVDYNYFAHSAGDYFAGKASYPDIDYQNIPTHTTADNIEHRLTDVIDLRSVQSNNRTGFTATGSNIELIPKNTNPITIGTVKYWEPRVDIISITTEGQILNYTGETSLLAISPTNVPLTDMKIYQVELQPYTFDKNDLTIIRYDNFGYKMRDIEKLEKRIANLEEAVTLNSTEIKTLQVNIPDPNDGTLPDRIKLGMTSDAFGNDLQSAILYDDYRSELYRELNTLMPMMYARDLPFYYDSDQSLGTIRKGSQIWPKYNEEVMINQSVASKSINVNQFEITRALGSGALEPEADTWVLRKQVDNKYKAQSTTSFIASGSTSVSSQGNKN